MWELMNTPSKDQWTERKDKRTSRHQDGLETTSPCTINTDQPCYEARMTLLVGQDVFPSVTCWHLDKTAFHDDASWTTWPLDRSRILTLSFLLHEHSFEWWQYSNESHKKILYGFLLDITKVLFRNFKTDMCRCVFPWLILWQSWVIYLESPNF